VTFEVGVVRNITARHHLVGDFGPASEPHEHTYRIEVVVSGETLGADGTLLDITVLQAALTQSLKTLDGADLNGIPDLSSPNPTAEVVARYIFHAIAAHLRQQGLSRLQTRVWESDEAFASYAGTLG
jgi:6-pyruvoyltetrahydropterin/6-carboxytetrahydropterin synthase